MSIESKLKDLSEDIRNWAVKRMFEEDGYNAEVAGEDVGILGGSLKKELDIERYETGQGSGPANAADYNDSYIARQGTPVWDKLYDQLSWVYDSVEKFGKGSPSELKRVITDTSTAQGHLLADNAWHGESNIDGDVSASEFHVPGTGPGAELLLGNAIHEAKNWSGSTAAVFVTTFGANGEKWRNVVQNNYFMTQALVHAAEAQLALIITARQDALNICKETLSQLKGMGEDDSGGAGVLLATLGAVTTVGLTVLSFGTAAAVAGAAFSITGAMISAAESGDDPKVEVGTESDISGSTAVQVLLSMNQAISKVESTLFESEASVANKLISCNNAALKNRDEFQIGHGEEGLQNVDEGWGEREVGAQLHYLETAATESFPNAVAPLTQASNGLHNIIGPAAAFQSEVYDLETSVSDPWQALRDLLQDLIGANATKVEAIGEAVLGFAVDADAVDDNAAGEIQDTYEDLTTHNSGSEHEPADPIQTY